MRRLYPKLIVYSVLGFCLVGFALDFVMAKDEDSKVSQTSTAPDAKVDGGSSSSKEAPSTEDQVNSKEQSNVKVDSKSDGQTNGKIRAGSCVASEGAIEDIQRSRSELEKRKKELEAREAELKVRENSIAEEMKKLALDRSAIQKVQNEQSRESEDKKSKLVETLLAMSPKAAAKLISSMDDSLAVSVRFQMDTQRLAKILNLVEPKKSTELSEKLVGLSKNQDLHSIRSLANQGVKADKNEKTKGGE